MNTQPLELDDILDSIMIEEQTPNYDALVRWSTRYPQFARELSDFFANWAIQAEQTEEIEVDTNRLSNLAVSHALDILHRRGSKNGSATASAVRLFKIIGSIGKTVQSVASELGLDEVLLKKLDLRRLTEVPERLCEVLGGCLSVSAESIRTMVTGGPPIANVAAHYKAKGKLTLANETFANAVEHSSLPDDKKKYWSIIAQAEKERI
jgi:hypothetical protein